MRYLFNLLIIILITSCSYRIGSISGTNHVNEINSKTVGVAMGSSSTTKILGTGGLSQKSLAYKAKQNLYENFKLNKDQYFTNFSIEYKYSFFPLWQKTTAQIHAEIKELDSANLKDENFRVVKYKQFNISDSVFIPKNASFSKAKIIEFDFDRMTCLNKSGRLKKVKYSKAYTCAGSLMLNDREYSINQTYSFSARNIRTNEIRGFENVTILGFNNQDMLIKEGNSFYEVIF